MTFDDCAKRTCKCDDASTDLFRCEAAITQDEAWPAAMLERQRRERRQRHSVIGGSLRRRRFTHSVRQPSDEMKSSPW